MLCVHLVLGSSFRIMTFGHMEAPAESFTTHIYQDPFFTFIYPISMVFYSVVDIIGSVAMHGLTFI